MTSNDLNYVKTYREAREKAESTVNTYIKECKDNGFTLKEMELMSDIFSEKIHSVVERAKYLNKI